MLAGNNSQNRVIKGVNYFNERAVKIVTNLQSIPIHLIYFIFYDLLFEIFGLLHTY